MGLGQPFKEANWMLCFSLKMSFFAVLMLEARFFLQLSRLIQIIFAIEWQFYLQSQTILIQELLTVQGDYSSFPFPSKSPVYDPRFTCKEWVQVCEVRKAESIWQFPFGSYQWNRPQMRQGQGGSESVAKHTFQKTLLCFWLLMNLWNESLNSEFESLNKWHWSGLGELIYITFVSGEFC